ncbi:hypothetical protein BC828DRAFT_393143 [Blastocladiella britannica]|nr:hypothetical protein BC828DRAFT_393143 [Blastocladiella britannica]
MNEISREQNYFMTSNSPASRTRAPGKEFVNVLSIDPAPGLARLVLRFHLSIHLSVNGSSHIRSVKWYLPP